MRFRHQVLVGVAVAAVAGAGDAAALARQRLEHRGGRAGFAERAERLGLSQDQREQMRKLRTEAVLGMIRRRADGALARLDLRQLLDNADPDASAIDAWLKQRAGQQAAALRERVEQRLALRRLLTPEQRSKLRELPPLARPLGRRSRMGAAEREPRPGEDSPAFAEGDDGRDPASLTGL